MNWDGGASLGAPPPPPTHTTMPGSPGPELEGVHPILRAGTENGSGGLLRGHWGTAWPFPISSELRPKHL